MRLSLQTDYALRTLMFLASRKDKPRAKIADVAGFFGISEAHVARVVNLPAGTAAKVLFSRLNDFS